MKRRSFLLGSAAALVAGHCGRLLATDTPPLRKLVVGLPLGAMSGKLANGTLDIINAHFNADYRLKVLDKRNTREATEAVKAAEPDGSTLLQVQSSSMVLFPSTYRSLNYDPLADFTPLAIMGEYHFALTLGPLVPASVTSLEGYLAWVEQNPDYRDVGFVLQGSQAHLISLMLARNKEIALRPQSYGTPKAMIGDLANHTLAACIAVPGNLVGLPRETCRAVAISSATRLPQWPGVATFSEQGLAALTMAGWFGWFAPAGLPAATATRLREQIITAQATPAYQALRESLLLTAVDSTPALIRARISEETAAFKRLVDSYGLKEMA